MNDIGPYLTALALAIESSPLPFAICYPDGALMNCNRAFSELTGYSKDELYRMPGLHRLSPPSYTEAELSDMKAILEDGRPRRREKELIRQDGGRVRVESFLHYVADLAGKPKFYYYFISDLSDRARIVRELDLERVKAESLAEKADRNLIELEAVLSSLSEAVEVYGINGVSMRANSAAKACYGFDPSGMDADALFNKIAFRYIDGQAVAPEESPQLLAAAGKPGVSGRFLIKNARGHDSMIMLSASPLIVKGQACGAVCAWHDVTERERLLEQLEKDRKMLRESKMHTELYFDLMSHDIININQVGMGYLELAMDKLEDGEVRLLLSRSLEAFAHSSKLIDNVSKIRRAKSGDVPMEAVDLGKLLADIAGEYGASEGRDISIRYACAGGCLVRANELLEDVFSNIIGNSVKHSAGPLSVDVAVSRAFQDGRAYYKVAIEDDGPGIPDELKGKIFIRFQKDMTRARSKGIGLYLVKSLVESFGGSIWVEDRVPGDYAKGCRFVVLLPAYVPES